LRTRGPEFLYRVRRQAPVCAALAAPAPQISSLSLHRVPRQRPACDEVASAYVLSSFFSLRLRASARHFFAACGRRPPACAALAAPAPYILLSSSPCATARSPACREAASAKNSLGAGSLRLHAPVKWAEISRGRRVLANTRHGVFACGAGATALKTRCLVFKAFFPRAPPGARVWP